MPRANWHVALGCYVAAPSALMFIATSLLVGCKSEPPLSQSECVGTYESFSGSKNTGTSCFILHGDGSYSLGGPQPNDALGYFHLAAEGHWQLGRDSSWQRLLIDKTTLPIERKGNSVSVTVNDDLGMYCVLTPGKATGTQKPAWPPRPTVTPPPFKVFHTTDNSITLVTDANATDDQIAAILWQLHDAAHNNTFATLHIPQKFVDARDPMIWFHIYRSPNCADEKYTTGKLPCGPSYHAAGDYTLGSFTNKNRDDAVLLHGDDKQTELWNPDAPH